MYKQIDSNDIAGVIKFRRCSEKLQWSVFISISIKRIPPKERWIKLSVEKSINSLSLLRDFDLCARAHKTPNKRAN